MFPKIVLEETLNKTFKIVKCFFLCYFLYFVCHISFRLQNYTIVYQLVVLIF